MSSFFPICIFGENKEEVELVAKFLLDYEKLCLGSSSSSSNKEDDKRDHILSIATKYYTAELPMSLGVLPESITSDTSLPDGCECCILVSSSKEEMLKGNLEATGKRAADSSVDIKMLLILQDEDNSSSVDSFRGDRVLWTLDHSFEYIEINRSNPTEGHDLREKDGLPRVMEALHTNMWSTMERLDPSAKPSQKNGNATTNETVFSMPLLSKADQNDAITDAKNGKEMNKDVPSTSEVSNDSDGPPIGYKGLGDAKDEDDKMWDNFSTTIEAAKQLREQSVGGQLSDEARRHRAAEIAMKMCAMMDLGEDDSDEED